jgi:hypothetical protein
MGILIYGAGVLDSYLAKRLLCDSNVRYITYRFLDALEKYMSSSKKIHQVICVLKKEEIRMTHFFENMHARYEICSTVFREIIPIFPVSFAIREAPNFCSFSGTIPEIAPFWG